MLAEAKALFTRPWLSLTAESARERVDAEGLLGELSGKDVLCLAGGGGQQSAAFALLGANVTVTDLSEAQLERDRVAAEHYGLPVTIVQSDMRDLTAFGSAAFDIVFQPHSLGFVPDARVVFVQVARVLRPGGIYFFSIANPFYAGLSEADWNGEGYVLKLPYQDGAEFVTRDWEWVYPAGTLAEDRPPPCREYRQTLSRLLNGLVEQGFSLLRVSDTMDLNADLSAEPGTWDHRNAIAPAWLAIWVRKTPAHDGQQRQI
jgi:2-polyprenyl-3-methyl-5-hydroxy-6-metoxy-1,4-benzoquinol methylase